MSTSKHCCAELTKAIEDPDVALQFIAKFREYGVSVLDGGSSFLKINFCPWCGSALPRTLRDEWFDSLESQGVDPLDAEAIPPAYRDSAWYA